MKNILITGGTVFVSRYMAEYYVKKGHNVYVLNRGSREQSKGVVHIKADRHELGGTLKKYHFDVVIDVTAYNSEDIRHLLDALGEYDDYIMISSSAVYPEDGEQPFKEDSRTGENKFWGKYGTDKLYAEEILLKREPSAYILRPPYLYGPMNNVYRESFVFDCALSGRKFYLPGEGLMKLQFFHVEDLCRFTEIILDKHPERRIFNVGNRGSVSVRDWVNECYSAVGRTAEFVSVSDEIEQRNYFSFYNYEYCLDVNEMCGLMPETKPFSDGIAESLEWYLNNSDSVRRKPFFEFIDSELDAKSLLY